MPRACRGSDGRISASERAGEKFSTRACRAARALSNQLVELAGMSRGGLRFGQVADTRVWRKLAGHGAKCCALSMQHNEAAGAGLALVVLGSGTTYSSLRGARWISCTTQRKEEAPQRREAATKADATKADATKAKDKMPQRRKKNATKAEERKRK